MRKHNVRCAFLVALGRSTRPHCVRRCRAAIPRCVVWMSSVPVMMIRCLIPSTARASAPSATTTVEISVSRYVEKVHRIGPHLHHSFVSCLSHDNYFHLNSFRKIWQRCQTFSSTTVIATARKRILQWWNHRPSANLACDWSGRSVNTGQRIWRGERDSATLELLFWPHGVEFIAVPDYQCNSDQSL